MHRIERDLDLEDSGSRSSQALPDRPQPVQPPHQPPAITLDGELPALVSIRNRLRAVGQECVPRPLCAGDAPPLPRSKETTVECCRRSKPVWWAWLDLNQRPHPQLNAGNRCADDRFRRSCPTVGQSYAFNRRTGMRSSGLDVHARLATPSLGNHLVSYSLHGPPRGPRQSAAAGDAPVPGFRPSVLADLVTGGRKATPVAGRLARSLQPNEHHHLQPTRRHNLGPEPKAKRSRSDRPPHTPYRSPATIA